MVNFNKILGINDLRDIHTLWKALLAEFLGNVLLNFFGCASWVGTGALSPTKKAMAFGLVMYLSVQTLRHVSGGHFNPAITASMMSIGKIRIIKGILYILIQCVGSSTGSACLKALLPEELHGTRGIGIALGNTQLGYDFSAARGFGIECVLGFMLVLVVCGVYDPNKPEAKPMAAFAVGMAVTVGHLAAVEFTGSGMNPARSFGTALITSGWTNHWVYWTGPILGGIMAALIYTFIFSAPTLTTVKDEKEKEPSPAKGKPKPQEPHVERPVVPTAAASGVSHVAKSHEGYISSYLWSWYESLVS